MALERNGVIYASHTLIGDKGDAFFSMTPLEKALYQGWSEGCPVAVTLTKEPGDGGRGAENMIPRYGEVNFWFGYMRDTFIKNGRQDLANQMTQPIKRLPDEPLGKHDDGWVPDELTDYILNTPYGYSLPRVLIAYVKNSDENDSFQARRERLQTALEVLDKVTSNSANITELLVTFTDQLIKEGGDKKILIKNMIPQGKINEDNCHTIYGEITKTAQQVTPDLWLIYSNIPVEERVELRMADLS